MKLILMQVRVPDDTDLQQAVEDVRYLLDRSHDFPVETIGKSDVYGLERQ
jgi:hypothetical protein